jgi:hypothetical protein
MSIRASIVVFVAVVVGLALAAVPSEGAEQAAPGLSPQAPGQPSLSAGVPGQRVARGGVPSQRVPNQRAPSYIVGVSFDPASGEVQLLPPHGRGVVDASFELVSAACTNCGGGCPPWGRTLEVVLRATAAVPAGFGVSSLTSTNYSVTGVSHLDDALVPGQTVTITIEGDVLNCVNAPRTNLYFDICDAAPATWSDPCPTGLLTYDSDNTVVATTFNYWPWGDANNLRHQIWISQSSLSGFTGIVQGIRHFLYYPTDPKIGVASWNLDVYLSSTSVNYSGLSASDPESNHGADRTLVFSGTVPLTSPVIDIDVDDVYNYQGDGNLLIDYVFNQFNGVGNFYDGPVVLAVEDNNDLWRVTIHSGEGNVVYSQGTNRTAIDFAQ